MPDLGENIPATHGQWWTIHPVTGTTTRVLPAGLIEDARRRQHDADAEVGVLREAAARALVTFRRAQNGWTDEESKQARDDLRGMLDWMARGGLESRR